MLMAKEKYSCGCGDGLSKGRRLVCYLYKRGLCRKELISSGISYPIIFVPADARKIISQTPDYQPQPPEKTVFAAFATFSGMKHIFTRKKSISPYREELRKPSGGGSLDARVSCLHNF